MHDPPPPPPPPLHGRLTEGRLIFKHWIDIARLDPAGPGSRTLAELISWQAVSKAFLESEAGRASTTIQQILRDSNRLEVFTAACQAMCDMDIRPWLPRITSPALVLGGDEDIMTPWDQGPAAPARRRSTRASRMPRST